MASGATGVTDTTNANKGTQPGEVAGSPSVTLTEPGTTAGPSTRSKRIPPAWMEKPTNIENCPDGLQYLAGLDQVFVEEGVDYDKVIARLACKSYHLIKNNQGERIYYAVERSMGCCRFVCGERRYFGITLHDQTGKAILKLQHPLACDFFGCPCCLQEMKVGYVAGGFQRLLGSVKQVFAVGSSKFVVKNSEKEIQYKIRSPRCACSCLCCCCCDCTCKGPVDFRIFPLRVKTEIGRITRNLPIVGKHIAPMNAAYCFGMNFPKAMNPETKAGFKVMIGAMFLIGFCFYEVQRNVMVTMCE